MSWTARAARSGATARRDIRDATTPSNASTPDPSSPLYFTVHQTPIPHAEITDPSSRPSRRVRAARRLSPLRRPPAPHTSPRAFPRAMSRPSERTPDALDVWARYRTDGALDASKTRTRDEREDFERLLREVRALLLDRLTRVWTRATRSNGAHVSERLVYVSRALRGGRNART